MNEAVFNAGDTAPNGVLSREIDTTAGETYALTLLYSWGCAYSSPQSTTASVLDRMTVLATALEIPPISSDGYTSAECQPFQRQFTALSSATTIQFEDYNTNYTHRRDRSITGTDVSAPESASLTLLALGAGATMLRRASVE